mmetsp:Transcript_44173/g.51768  ORF Transcript_44173/g.51768 Transcript_44173/m.51768 type:complete len:205 (-) Transcript_44173:366-980(-)
MASATSIPPHSSCVPPGPFPKQLITALRPRSAGTTYPASTISSKTLRAGCEARAPLERSARQERRTARYTSSGIVDGTAASSVSAAAVYSLKLSFFSFLRRRVAVFQCPAAARWWTSLHKVWNSRETFASATFSSTSSPSSSPFKALSSSSDMFTEGFWNSNPTASCSRFRKTAVEPFAGNSRDLHSFCRSRKLSLSTSSLLCR